MIMARKSNTAVIFRRGPSRWTQIIKWNTKKDTFEYGHWFSGRVYERRCDLSPDGTKLIYFVSKFNRKTIQDSEYTYAWTAISKPPWLTALALWPKGDCWHGGGMFESNEKVFLNHKPEQSQPHPKHQPKRLAVVPNPNAAGENEPLYSMRLTRDGWNLVEEWKIQHKYGSGFVTDQPEERLLRHPRERHLQLLMRKMLRGYRYWEEYEILDTKTGDQIPLIDVECANWDQRGRLVLLTQGKLKIGRLDENNGLKQKELVDFNNQEPEEIDSPAWAKRW